MSLPAAVQDAVDAGAVVDRGMVLFDFPSGLWGFWTGTGPFTWSGVTFTGAGRLIALDPVEQVSDLSAVPVTLRLSSVPDSALTPDLLATIEAEQYHQRPATLYTAYFDPETRALLDVVLEYRGEVDRIVHERRVGGEAVLRVMLESRSRDHPRRGWRMRSDADQREIDPDDGFFRFVNSTAEERVLFGRSDQKAKPRKKPWWQFW